jgi:hypothetical protein
MENKKCPTCKKNDATKPHPCPFEEEINDNPDELCTCCPDCEQECAECT